MNKLIVGQNDFETVCKQNGREDLLSEWHFAKNGDKKPSDYLPASNKTVWWVCCKGHEWQAKIENRMILGRNCPYCYGRRPIVGENDLQTVFPELAKEWHPTKNGELKPSDVKQNTGKKVWWKCEFGHEWQAVIESRSKGVGCPFCSNKKVLKGYNDLATTNPKLAEEWNFEKNSELTPNDVVSGSQKKVWWKCEYGHEWKTAIINRTNGSGCPYCNGLGSSMPEQGIAFYLGKVCRVEQRIRIDGKEVDVFLPEYNIGIEYDGILYHEGKEVRDAQKTLHLADRNIYLIRIKESEANDVIDSQIITFDGHTMNDNYAWALKQLFILLCSLTNNPVFNTLSVDLNSDMLKIREKFNLYKKENSLIVSNPELANEWDTEKNGILKPEMFFAGSRQKVWWKCSKGHEWQSDICNRTKGSGCPYCSGQRVIIGETDLATTNPELAAEWNYEKNKGLKNGLGEDISIPERISSGSNFKVWWIGKCGHEWDMSICDRTGYKHLNCPYCSGHRLGKGINDLATTTPELISEWDYEKNGGLMPSDVTAGLNRKVWWKCKKGHTWQASIHNRSIENGTGCPYCSGHKVVKGENDLETLFPELAKEWHPNKNGVLKPSDYKAYSSAVVWWICERSHEWKAAINNRSGGQGCPYCGNKQVLKGFNDLATTNPELAVEWDSEKNGMLTPSDIVAGSNKKVWWKCDNGHEWKAMVNDRSAGCGCPYCSNKRILKGFNDLATTNPMLAAEWNYEKNGNLSPNDVAFGSQKKVWWKCPKGHEWESIIYNRSKGHGCPFCANCAPKSVLCVETGNVYSSTGEAARQTGASQASISSCCNGKQKTAGGYHWKYVDEE